MTAVWKPQETGVASTELTSADAAGIDPRRKGKAGELRVKALLARAGWAVGLQPASGGSGTRAAAASRQGDLWAACGEARLRIEVKHYQHEPRALQALRAGSDVLAYICSGTGKLALMVDEALFVDLLAWSAQALADAGGRPSPCRWPRRTLRPAQRTNTIDAEIARARLEAFIADADDRQLVQLDQLARRV